MGFDGLGCWGLIVFQDHLFRIANPEIGITLRAMDFWGGFCVYRLLWSGLAAVVVRGIGGNYGCYWHWWCVLLAVVAGGIGVGGGC